MEVGRYATVAAATREHGNSYLALLEYVGLLGIVPFVVLIRSMAARLHVTEADFDEPALWPDERTEDALSGSILRHQKRTLS